MFRMWAKAFKSNKMMWDMEVSNDTFDTRTHKIMASIEKVCNEKDLSIPIWLDKNIADFKRTAKVKFRKDNFIDEIDFDFLEFHVIEEDFEYMN